MQFQICNSGDVWVSLSRAEAHRIAKKRTGALARLVRVRRAAQAEAREYRRAERELQAELRDADRRNRALWKPVRVKPEQRAASALDRRPRRHVPTRSGWLAGASSLPSYSGQIIDRMGRAGIFVRIRYYGRSSKAGVGRRATLYIWEGAYQTADGRVLFESNVAENAEEAMAALEMVELVNREAQAGGKALFHMIANVPYQLAQLDDGPERMMEIGRRFADHALASRDLPYALALHPPSEEGDQRNWHLHLIFSARPLVRTADHQWDLGQMLRREIDNPKAFEGLRHLYAAVQTDATKEAGLNIAYTALSNAERGLPNAPQQHLGPGRTARARRGEEEPVNERNWETMLAGEAALMDERLRHRQEADAAQLALVEHVQTRAAPMLVAMTPMSPLAIAAPLKPAATISLTAPARPGVWQNGRPSPTALPISNLKPRASRDIAVPSAVVTQVANNRERAATISLPATRLAASNVARTTSLRLARKGGQVFVASTLPLLAIELRQRGLGIASRLSARAYDPSTPMPFPTARAISTTVAIPLSAKHAALLGDSAGDDGRMGHAIGVVRSVPAAKRDVARVADPSSLATPFQDVEAIFRLLDRRAAEAEEKRKRTKELSTSLADVPHTKRAAPTRTIGNIGNVVERQSPAVRTWATDQALLRRVAAANEALTKRWLATRPIDETPAAVRMSPDEPRQAKTISTAAAALAARFRDGQGR